MSAAPANVGCNVIDAAHLAHQREWSTATFGPGSRLLGVLDHIRKELVEIEAEPADLSEWVDVLILAFDGAWRAGWEPQQIIDAIKAKQARNEARTWPDWRSMSAEKAIEHDRTFQDYCGDCGKPTNTLPCPHCTPMGRDGTTLVNVTYDGTCPVHHHRQTFTGYGARLDEATRVIKIGDRVDLPCALGGCVSFPHLVVGICTPPFSAHLIEDEEGEL